MTEINASQINVPPPPAPPVERLVLTRAPRRVHLPSADVSLRGAAALSAMWIIVILIGLVGILLVAALPSIRNFGTSFLTTTEWRPNELEVPKRDAQGHIVIEDGETVMETIPPKFGALPFIWGTAVSSIIALVIAVPLSLFTAMFLVRIAPNWMKGPVSFLVEFLAAIPSIAYGIWGLFVLAPFLALVVEPSLKNILSRMPIMFWMLHDTVRVGSVVSYPELAATGHDMLCGGLVLSIMIVPIITAISRDVLRQVPRAQIEGTVALGATWWQSASEMFKYSRSGLFGAVILGLARAAGETMAITMVIGNSNRIRMSLLAPAQTMSSLLANEFAEASTDLHRAALSEVALILLIMSLLFNVIARYLVVGKGGRTAQAL